MGSSLQRELKQKKPFTSLKHEVIVNLARTAAVIQHEIECELKPFGLTLTQFNVLRILRGAGAEGLCQFEIGERLVAQVPDVPRLLARMEKARLIQRQRTKADKRVVISLITEQGAMLLTEVDKLLDREQPRLVARLSDMQLRKLNELLSLLRER